MLYISLRWAAVIPIKTGQSHLAYDPSQELSGCAQLAECMPTFFDYALSAHFSLWQCERRPTQLADADRFGLARLGYITMLV